MPLGDEREIEPTESREPVSEAEARILLAEADGRAAARAIEAIAGEGLEVRHAHSLGLAGEIFTEWSPSIVVISQSVLAEGPAAWLAEIRVPVILLAGDNAVQRETLGPRFVRLEANAEPSEVLEAIRALAD